MTKLEKLEKEYNKAMLDLYMEDGAPEMYRALQNKCNRLLNEIEEEKNRLAKKAKK